MNPSTRITVGYDKDKKPIGEGKAPESDMQLSRVSNTGKSVTHWVKLESKIPLLDLVPAIDAEYGAKVYRNGTGHVEGTNDQAPSHEFYIAPYATGGGWKKIMTHKHVDFKYLFPPFPNNEYKVDLR
ncbi:hypothetical protein [Salinithrix halophila]|uniref:Uncharacterized protein n=1 Tax=Salinithrix halophila TaxID=1485204 RepID=A0ABV8JGQ3_9BACL